MRKHQYAPAIRDLRRALVLEPDYSGDWHNLAVAYLEQGDYRQAEVCARTALRWYALRADTRAILGQILLARGRPRLAEKEFQHSLALDPQRPATHYEYARMLLRQQRYAEAVKQL